ncbi:ubiquinone/menaquinone biosynthesis methyltransferase [bacterium BMS3Abin04]|nr:ubiquinone/menaquinone biosynthesis methyltransferase [bacterium BMS3Abin04]
MEDKKHWYDGIIYDKFIAPNQDRIFSVIASIIKPDSTVVDIGCGTCRLPFFLSDKCLHITGIDLSSKNIKVANSKLKKGNYENVELFHGDATRFANKLKRKYDYATVTFVLHEMPPEERIKMLEVMKTIADKIIIGDYIAPIPESVYGKITQVVEFLAGKDHYNNFKNYEKNGGVHYLLQQAGLKLVKEIKKMPNTSLLVVAE